MPRSIQHPGTETDETHLNTDDDAHHELVVVGPRTGRAMAEGAR